MSKKKYKKIWLEDEEGNVEFVSGEIMATFKQGDVIKKFKVGADSLNEFEILLNGEKSVIRKFSDVAVELTSEEEQVGIMK